MSCLFLRAERLLPHLRVGWVGVAEDVVLQRQRGLTVLGRRQQSVRVLAECLRVGAHGVVNGASCWCLAARLWPVAEVDD